MFGIIDGVSHFGVLEKVASHVGNWILQTTTSTTSLASLSSLELGSIYFRKKKSNISIDNQQLNIEKKND